uniref:Putative penicillin-binding protein n=1 Tax=uncultured Acidobacteriota bacterium TaxID=171953 RepID=Q7X359_9BACT|nr:putative penicillin-binding protein [uncultured Acidobacteriota bacterium]
MSDKNGGRQEPHFDVAPQLYADPADRPPSDAPPKPKRKPRKAKAKASAKSSGKKKSSRSPFGRLIYWAAVLALWLGIAGIGAVVWIGAHLPPIQSLEIPKRPPSISILDMSMKPVATRGDQGGGTLTLKELPPHLPKAFIAIEDRRFYDHYGIDPFGIARAATANVLRRGVSQGGSTITQQLAKNLFLTQERTMKRKLQEAMLAIWLERKFSKDEILALYLNRVYFGAGAYGVEQAAQKYFGKSARRVTVAEAAMLAGLIKSPSRLAPTRNFDAAQDRSRLVLAAMRDQGFISPANEKLALAHPPAIVAQAANGSVHYVADWVMDVVNDHLGHFDEDIVVVTTIDMSLQANAEKALSEELVKRGDKAGASQGALLAMTPNGNVRALIGGRNYADSQFNRAVAAKRQPGSAFKPFVYLTALENGLTPDAIRDDRPIKVQKWAPENYNNEYQGAVPLWRALAMSLNSVSVRLTLQFGPMAVIRTAHRLGIASLLEPNASISLGTSEVSMLELVGAYATFANGGYAVMPHVIERISTPSGKVLYVRNQQPLGRIIEEKYVGMMNEMMQQTIAIGTARGASLPGWQAAGKTGTSQDFRDAWFIGYTGQLVTGVWLGNDDGSPMKKVTGGSLPVEIWSRFMRTAHQGVPVAALPNGSSGGGFLQTLAGVFSNGQAPTPPAEIPQQPRAQAGRGLDSWLLDSLFGRRN